MRKQIPVEDERFPRGWESICGYAFVGCGVSKTRDYFEKICSVDKGELCGFKELLYFQLQLDKIFKIL